MTEMFLKLFDIPKHIHWLIKHQKGGWGEYIDEKKPHPISPQVTAQGIIGLLPFLNLSEFRDLHDTIKFSIQQSLKFLSDCLDTEIFGWGDHSRKYVLIDETASSLLACLACKEIGIDLPENLKSNIGKIILFLIDEQNEDGGWGLRKGDDSRIQFTFWVLKSLKKAQNILSHLVDDTKLIAALDNGKAWLKRNLEGNNNKGFSIIIGSEINAFATAYGVEISCTLDTPINKEEIVKFLMESQIKKGEWDTPVDAITYDTFPRRVYNFADYPKIIESLLLLDENIKSELFKSVLEVIRNLESPQGGFKHQVSDTKPVGWFTCQAIKMFSSLINALPNIAEESQNGIKFPVHIKQHTFHKAVLMIGRFQPPHLGHYNGLRATMESNENEFYLPGEVLKELLGIDQIFIGVARSTFDKENPFPIGSVKDIWRYIIDEDAFLSNRSNKINIESCPAEKNLINIEHAVFEITSDKNSIFVLSGNDRIIQQCKKAGIKYLKFKRKSDISGTKIRNLISRINFGRHETNKKEKETLKSMLHPKAYEFMERNDLFIVAQKVINSI